MERVVAGAHCGTWSALHWDRLPPHTCLAAPIAEKLGTRVGGVSSYRSEPKAISSPSLPSAFAFVFKWFGLLTHTLFFWDIQLNFISVYYASLLLETVTVDACFRKDYWIIWPSTRVQTSRMGFFLITVNFRSALTPLRLQKGKLSRLWRSWVIRPVQYLGQGCGLHLRIVLYLQVPGATGSYMWKLLFLKDCASLWEWHLSLSVFKTQFES